MTSYVDLDRDFAAAEPLSVLDMLGDTLAAQRAAAVPDPFYPISSQPDDADSPIEFVDASEELIEHDEPRPKKRVKLSPLSAEDNQPEFSETDVNTMRRLVKSMLCGKFPDINSSTLRASYNELKSVLENTICDRQGNSALFLGPRGCGKSLVINTLLKTLAEVYPKQFLVIRLNAFLHSDDKTALREIARQLDAHSAHVGGSGAVSFEQRAINETFSNILLSLDSLGESRLAIVFVVEEIDRYTALGTQTFLYNLFDLAQSSRTPICVIGVSANMRVPFLFEKRVSSRFSQRIVSVQKAGSLEEFWHSCKLTLAVPEDAFSQFDNQTYPTRWNTYIELLFNADTGMRRVLDSIYKSTKSYLDFQYCCMHPVSAITPDEPFPDPDLFLMYRTASSAADSAFAALSLVELLLVIAAARCAEKANTVNFNLAYAEYVSMMEQHNLEATTLLSRLLIDQQVLASFKVLQKVHLARVMRDVWARLYDMRLLVGDDFLDSAIVQPELALEEIGRKVGDLHPFRKLCRL